MHPLSGLTSPSEFHQNDPAVYPDDPPVPSTFLPTAVRSFRGLIPSAYCKLWGAT